MSDAAILPSWRPGAARDALVDFLENAGDVDQPDRVAIFDNDGTLWCERPTYPQVYFLIEELRAAAADRPALAERPEYRAVLAGDRTAIAELGVEQVAMALVELHEGMTPEAFTARVERFFAETSHPDRGVPFGSLVYVPMLELLAELRTRGFRTFISTGGGADFVRTVSERLYEVGPEQVIGSRVRYEVLRPEDRIELRRTARLDGDPNEGPAKLEGIQRQIGRRPILAAGNSPGDSDMLDYAAGSGRSSLALLIDHDDARREYAYESVAGTFDTPEPILHTAARRGWTVVSMRDDWETVFGE